MTASQDAGRKRENVDDQQNDKQTITAGKVIPVYVEDEMQKCYIDYAMSVIVQRALPDVRDGLKPVHRRILYAMNEAGMLPNKAYKKSARIVGDVLGKYHPHGDSSVYDAIVRLAQDFSTRYLMVDGHGNFGSVDGDPPAAMRYTEVRMGKIAVEMLRDIEKDTVDFIPNYDESLKEPTVLPAKVPALLINGSAGIAVGMATNIPPHNLGEVVDACVMLIDHPDATIEQLMTAIKGPDFPTGAKILGLSGIRQAYTTGRGVVKVRAKAHVEPMPKNKNRIVVTEIPYQVNKAKLIENIAHLVQDKTLEGITDLRDESDRKGMRIVIELRSDVVPEIMLNKLYKHTQLQDSFGIIMLALVSGHANVVAVIFSGNPIFVTILAFLLLRESIRWNNILALVLEVLGILAIAVLGGGGGSLLSVVLAILAALFFALYAVLGKRETAQVGTIVVTCGSFLFGSVELLVLLLLGHTGPVSSFYGAVGLDMFQDVPLLQGINLQSLPYLLFIGIVSTGLGYVFHMFAIEKTSATHGSLVFFFKPILAPLVALAVLGLSVAALYGCYQSYIGVDIVASQQDMNLNQGMPGRVYSFFDNPNNFAEQLAMLLPLNLALFLNSHWRGKLLSLLSLGVGLVAIGATYGRASWIGLAGAVLVFLALLNWRWVPVFLLVGLAAIPFLPETIYNRILTIFNAGEDSSVQYRFGIYETTRNLMEDYWARGVGLGTDVMKKVFQTYPTNFDGSYPVHTHNNYLQMWGETGILGLLAYLSLLLYQLKSGVKGFCAALDPRVKRMMAAAIGAFCGILVIGVAEYTWYYPRNMFTYWFLFGVIGACIKLVRMEQDKQAA